MIESFRSMKPDSYQIPTMLETDKEKLQDLLIHNLSRQTKTMAIQLVGNDFSKVAVLWDWLNNANDPLKWRAAWVFEELCLKHPAVLAQYLDDIAELFPTLTHVPLRRMLGHLLAESVIPESYESEIVDVSFQWLQDVFMPPAVRVHCMSIIFNLTKKYPELKQELKSILLFDYELGSAGYKNRASKILAKLGNA